MKINSFTVQLILTAVKFTLTNNIIWNLSKIKFLTKAKTCYYDQLAKYQNIIWILFPQFSNNKTNGKPTENQQHSKISRNDITPQWTVGNFEIWVIFYDAPKIFQAMRSAPPYEIENNMK